MDRSGHRRAAAEPTFARIADNRTSSMSTQGGEQTTARGPIADPWLVRL
jgi:hypothetical protein